MVDPGALGPALVAALLASLLAGFVGTTVVLRKLVALGGGVAHAAFGGIGLALVLGVEPRLGAIAVAVVAAAVLSSPRIAGGERQDAVIGVLWAVGMALGIWWLSGRELSDTGVEGYLFGDLAAVRAPDLVLLAGLDVAVIALFARYGRELVATAFDAEHAELQGLPVRALGFVLLLLVSLSVVALLGLVGIVLAIALLSIPALVALRLFRGLGAIVAAGCVVALVMSLSGLALAERLNRPPGPAIVLVGAVLLGLSRLLSPALRRGRPAR